MIIKVYASYDDGSRHQFGSLNLERANGAIGTVKDLHGNDLKWAVIDDMHNFRTMDLEIVDE